MSVLPLLLVCAVTLCYTSDVVTLTADNFDSLVDPASEQQWLLEFYAPWCGHCKKLAPVFEQLATQLKGKVKLGKIDCTIEKTLAKRFKVRGYPSLKLVTNGKLYPYRGRGRTVETLTDFINDGYLTASSPAKYPVAGEEPVVEETEMPNKAAPRNSDPHAAAGAAAPTPAAGGADADLGHPKSALWEAPGALGKKGRWDGSPQKSDLVRTLTDDNFDAQTKTGKWLMQFCIPGPRQCEVWRATMDRLASTVKAEGIKLAAVDCTLSRPLCDRLQITEFPTFQMVTGGKVHSFSGQRSHDRMADYAYGGYKKEPSTDVPAKGTPAPAEAAAAYENVNTAGPAVAAAPPVESVDDKDVVVLTDANARTTMETGGKDGWLMEIYAPWCKFCKKLAPTWAQLATKLKNENSPIGVVKVDGTEQIQTATAFAANGFPSIRYVDPKAGVFYEYRSKTRTIEAFVAWAEGGYKRQQAKKWYSPESAREQKPNGGVAPAPPSGPVDAKDIVVLSDATAKETLTNGSKDIWLLKIYAPWCGHCKKMAPEWARLATQHKDGKIGVADLDATVNPTTAAAFAANGYPSIRLVVPRKGKYYEYRARERTAVAFTKWAQGGYQSGVAKDWSFGEVTAAPAFQKRSVGTVAHSNLWDAPDAPGKLGRWDGSPAKSMLIRDVSGIHGLTEFANTDARGRTALLQFCSVGERQCVNYRPTLERLASTLSADSIGVVAIDCDNDAPLCAALGVKQPEVRALRNGKTYAYNGARKHDQLVEFATGGYMHVLGVPLPAATGAAPAAASTGKTATKAAATPAFDSAKLETQLVGNSVSLDANNFAAHTANGNWLINFGNANNERSKAFSSGVWQKLGEKLGKDSAENAQRIGHVDCATSPSLCGAFGVLAVPAIKHYTDGQYRNFNGAKTSNELAEFAEWGYSNEAAIALGTTTAAGAATTGGSETPFFLKPETYFVAAVSIFVGALVSKALAPAAEKQTKAKKSKSK